MLRELSPVRRVLWALRMHKSWFAIVLALAACSGKKDDNKPAKAAPATASKATEAAPKSAEELFSGKTVTLPAPIAKLRFGMPEADAKAAAPDVLAPKYGYDLPGYEPTKINIQIEDGRVYQPRLEIKKP